MWRIKFNRTQYWIGVAFILALKVAGYVWSVYAPEWAGTLRSVDIALVVTLTMFVGARFADIGWPRWLGISLTLFFAIGLPIAAMFMTLKGQRLPRDTSDWGDLQIWLGLIVIVLLIFLVIAGVPKSKKPGAPARGPIQRIEPRFD